MEVKEILKEVCSILDMNVDRVLSGSRKREIINIKKVTAYIAWGYRHSLQHIAEEIGLDNHASVINLRDKMHDALFTDSDSLLYSAFTRCQHLENIDSVEQRKIAIDVFRKKKLTKEEFIEYLFGNYKIIKRKKRNA